MVVVGGGEVGGGQWEMAFFQCFLIFLPRVLKQSFLTKHCVLPSSQCSPTKPSPQSQCARPVLSSQVPSFSHSHVSQNSGAGKNKFFNEYDHDGCAWQ